MQFIEDHQGGDITELKIYAKHAVIIVTHDYREFFKIEICNRDGSPISWRSNWIDFDMSETDGNPSHVSFGEMEVVQVENGHVYIDSDCGSFDFTADQTIPPSKKPNQPPQHNAGSRPSSDDSPASETPSSLGPRG